MATQVVLKQPPTDGIASLAYSRVSPQLLLVASWDSGVRVYDTSLNSLRYYYMHSAAVLDVAFCEEDSRVLSGGLAKTVALFDCTTSTNTELGSHDKPIKCVEYSMAHRVAVTGSWDKTVRTWDPRSDAKKAVATAELPERCYTMGLSESNDTLVVGTAERHVLVFDMRALDKGPVQKRESPFKFQTRCIRTFTTGDGYAISSIDGRVGMEFLAEADESKNYAFRCHRKKVDGVTQVYPVNALAFNPAYGTFATGGCDGSVATWDGVHKKRLANISGFPTSIAALAFNCNGTQLAIASSYTYERGEAAHPEDSITIRTVTDKEVKPRTAKK